jgi:Protein  of unknown function (DUF3018)
MSQPKKPPRSEEERRAARRERERRDRAKRAQGLKRVTVWVRDTRSPAFREEARRQIQRIAANPAEHAFAELWAQGADTSGWLWDGEL